MTDRSVVVKLGASVQGYVSGMRQAKSATSDFTKGASKSFRDNSAQWDKLAGGLLKGGAVMALGVGYAVKSFADFDQQMSAVGAALNGTPAQMAAVTAAVREAGKASVFTSVEAGQAAEELAKAGLSAKDIVGGALTGAMNLAAAGAIGLADAATITGQSMKIFNLRGSDATHIADVLTAGANKSAAGVDDLGQALRQGGLVASQTGLTLEETVGTLSAFADNALMGSDAGTSLKTMLQRLNPQSKQAKQLMEKLGFSAYDAAGNFIGMDKLAGELQSSFKGMSTQQRNAAMQILFGSDAVRGANVLYKLGEDGIRKYTDAVDDQGAASRTAAKRLDNLKGDFEKLTGALSDLFITAGGSGNDALRGLVQHVTDLVDAFGRLPKPLQDGIFYMGAGLGAAALLGGGLIKLISSVQHAQTVLKDLGVTADLTGKSLGHLTSALIKGGLVIGVAALATEVQKMIYAGDTASVSIDGLADSLTHLDTSAHGVTTGALSDLFRDKTGIFRSDEQIVTTAEALDRFSTSAYNALGDSLDARLGRLQNSGAMDHFKGQVTQVDQALAQMVKSGNVDQANKAFAEFTQAAVAQGIEFDKLPPYFKAYLASLKGYYGDTQQAAQTTGELVDAQKQNAIASQNAGHAVEEAGKKIRTAVTPTNVLGQSIVDVDKKTGEATLNIQKLSDAVKGLNTPFLDSRAAARDLASAMDDITAAAKKNGKTLNINTQKGRENEAALDAVAQAGHRRVAALIDEGASQKEVTKAMKDANAKLREGGKVLGVTGKALDNYVEHAGFGKKATQQVTDALKELNRQHPKPSMKVQGDRAARAAIDSVQRRLEKLSRSHASPSVKVVGVAQAMGDLGSIIGNMNVLDGKHATSTVTTRRVTNYVSTGTRQQPIWNRADGGPIYGPGTSRSDSILGVDTYGMPTARVSTGEFVTNADRYQQYKPLVEAINSGTAAQIRAYASRLAGFAAGGQVRFSTARIDGPSRRFSESAPAPVRTGPAIGVINLTAAATPAAIAHAIEVEQRDAFAAFGI